MYHDKCVHCYIYQRRLNTSAAAPKLDLEKFKCLEFIYYNYLDECLAAEETTEFLL